MSAPDGLAEPRTLAPRLERAAQQGRGITIVGDGVSERVEWSRLHEEARAAAALQALGVGPGTHVAMLGRSTREFVTAVQAVWLAGGTVVVLPLPLRLGSTEVFVQHIRNLVREADTGLVLMDPTLSSFLGGEALPGGPAVVPIDSLVVTGRLKDLVIVGGRNVYPQNVEWAVAQVEAVRAGNVVAFGVTDARGHERIVVMAETRATDRSALRRAVADRVQSTVGLPPTDVVLLEPGELPKTSSGKLQRRLSRSAYLGDTARTP